MSNGVAPLSKARDAVDGGEMREWIEMSKNEEGKKKEK